MFKQPDPQAFLQHTLTQSHYSWDHATWALHNQHHSPLLQVSRQIHLDGPNKTLKLLNIHIWEANVSSAGTLFELRPDCAVPSWPKRQKMSKHRQDM